MSNLTFFEQLTVAVAGGVAQTTMLGPDQIAIRTLKIVEELEQLLNFLLEVV